MGLERKITSRKFWVIFVYLLFYVGLPSRFSGADELTGEVRLVVSADGDRLVLDEEASVQIYAHLEGSEGILNEKFEIEFKVNVGKITDVKKSSSGKVKALYVPPDEFFPQYAMIAVVVRGSFGAAHSQLVLPLWGTGEVLVKTKKGASVKLRVKDKEFGPVKADSKGRAMVPIVTPPGVKSGVFGNKKIDLHLPPFKRIVAIPERNELVAGSQKEISVWIYSITQKGVPLKRPNIQVSAKRGKVSTPIKLSPGINVIKFTPPDLVENGKAMIKVSLTGEQASVDLVEIRLLPDKPARIVAKPKSKIFVAGQTQTATILVDVFDKNGNRTKTNLQGQASFGQVGKTRMAAVGKYEILLGLPNFFGSEKVVRVHITSHNGANAANAKTEINLQSAHPAKIKINLESDVVELGAGTTVAIGAQIFDEFDNKVLNGKLSLNTSKGKLSKPAVSKTGEFTFVYTPPIESKSPIAVITANSQGVSAQEEIELVSRRLLSITPFAGYFTNFSKLHSPCAAVQIEMGLDALLKGLRTRVGAGYFFFRQQSNEVTMSSTLHVVPLHGAFVYKFRVAKRFWLSVAAGAGVHVTTEITKLPPGDTIVNRDATYGLHGVLGAHVRLGIGEISFQSSYVYADESKIDGVSGRLGGLSLLMGYGFGLI